MAFLISTLAGLSTLIGIIFIYIKKNNNIINYSLAFASGVMLCVSIIDLIPESIILLGKTMNKNDVFINLLIFITIGLLIPISINYFIKEKENELYKVGILSMIAIIIHNIPEGIATYLLSSENLKLGIPLAIAISFHNIPEGISIAVPVYYGTNNKKKAIKMTLISALSEPVGAVIAFLFLKSIINSQIMGHIMAIIAGIMSNISLTELLPKSLKYGKLAKTIISFIIGFIFMYITIHLI